MVICIRQMKPVSFICKIHFLFFDNYKDILKPVAIMLKKYKQIFNLYNFHIKFPLFHYLSINIILQN